MSSSNPRRWWTGRCPRETWGWTTRRGTAAAAGAVPAVARRCQVSVPETSAMAAAASGSAARNRRPVDGRGTCCFSAVNDVVTLGRRRRCPSAKTRSAYSWRRSATPRPRTWPGSRQRRFRIACRRLSGAGFVAGLILRGFVRARLPCGSPERSRVFVPIWCERIPSSCVVGREGGKFYGITRPSVISLPPFYGLVEFYCAIDTVKWVSKNESQFSTWYVYGRIITLYLSPSEGFNGGCITVLYSLYSYFVRLPLRYFSLA